MFYQLRSTERPSHGVLEKCDKEGVGVPPRVLCPKGRGLVAILREEGLVALYRGAGWTAARNAPDRGAALPPSMVTFSPTGTKTIPDPQPHSHPWVWLTVETQDHMCVSPFFLAAATWASFHTPK